MCRNLYYFSPKLKNESRFKVPKKMMVWYFKICKFVLSKNWNGVYGKANQ